MVIRHVGWWFVVRSSPAFDLVGTVDLDNFFLVETHEITVGAFVQSPILVDGNVFLSHLHQDDIDCSDGSSEKRRVDFVKHHV